MENGQLERRSVSLGRDAKEIVEFSPSSKRRKMGQKNYRIIK
jgi:hypothetical protein